MAIRPIALRQTGVRGDGQLQAIGSSARGTRFVLSAVRLTGLGKNKELDNKLRAAGIEYLMGDQEEPYVDLTS